MKKRLDADAIANELRGGSAFFPDYNQKVSPTSGQPEQQHDQVSAEAAPRIGAPLSIATVEIERAPTTEKIPGPAEANVEKERTPVPLGVPPPVRGAVPRTPKIKRLIRQRQPFDIFEDQYLRLKQIAEAEREFVDGRGMSQMVREAIDQYLKEQFPSSD